MDIRCIKYWIEDIDLDNIIIPQLFREPSIIEIILNNIDKYTEKSISTKMQIAGILSSTLRDNPESKELLARYAFEKNIKIDEFLSGTYNYTLEDIIEIEKLTGITFIDI